MDRNLPLIEEGRQASNAWRVLGLLFLANLLNVYDRVIPAVIAEPLRVEFNLTDIHIGLVGTAFTLIYALAGVPLARLADGGSRRAVIGWGLAVWSGFTALTGLTNGLIGFALTRIGVGVGEASYGPAATSLISDLFPKNKRSRAIGIFMLGLPLGTVLGFFTVGMIASAFGSWRAPFFIAAVPGLLLAIVFYFVREPARGASESSSTGAGEVSKRPIRTILSQPTMWWVILSGMSYTFAAYAVNTFMVPLLQRYFDLDLKTAALITGAILGLSGLVAMTLGGVLADLVQQRYQRGRLLLSAVTTAAAALCIWFALRTDDVTVFAWLFGIGWLLGYLQPLCVYPTVQEMVVPQLRATAMAVYFACMYLLGAAFGSLVVGALSDQAANTARLAEGAQLLTDAHRAVGLHQAMIIVPIALLISAIACVFAAKGYPKAVKNVRAAMVPRSLQRAQ